MPLFHIIILSLLQAATEFLPVSSSGHLVLFHGLTEGGGASQWGEDLIMDLAVHVGTLAAVLVYFRRDILKMACALAHFICKSKEQDPENRNLALFIIAGSLPILVVGFILSILQPEWMRSVQIVAWTTLIFGIFLWVVDARSPAARSISQMSLRDAMIIGCAQVLALIPGTSRSGITMTSARFLGFSRTEAARYSFLLSVVATAAAGFLGAIKLYQDPAPGLALEAGIAALVTFIAALGVIAFLLKFLQRSTFKIFGIYRIALGIILLALVYLT